MTKQEIYQSDLELLDQYCEQCMAFINPFIFNQIRNRGLLWVINTGLPNKTDEAKAVVRTRLASVKKYFGDEEISQIASKVSRIEALRDRLTKERAGDVAVTIPILEEMLSLSAEIRDWYK